MLKFSVCYWHCLFSVPHPPPKSTVEFNNRRFMNRVLPLLLLSLAVLAVRLKSTHLAGTNRYNAEEELAKVTSQQSKFEEQFVALTREVESVSDVLSTTTNPDERINALETSLLQWRQDVFDLSRTIIPAFNLSKCSCEGITP